MSGVSLRDYKMTCYSNEHMVKINNWNLFLKESFQKQSRFKNGTKESKGKNLH